MSKLSKSKSIEVKMFRFIAALGYTQKGDFEKLYK